MNAVFTEGTLAFLAEAPQRDRDWFGAHRPLYQSEVAAPQRLLAEQVLPGMRALEAGLTESTVSRIHRDMRFAKGSPLRENIWICVHDPLLDPAGRPEFFFELFHNRYRYGMGYYSAPAGRMAQFREAVDRDPEAFGQVVAALPERFVLMGESYRQNRAGHLPEQLAAWYNRKSFWVQVEQPIDALVLGGDLAAHLVAEWSALLPLYRFLRAV